MDTNRQDSFVFQDFRQRCDGGLQLSPGNRQGWRKADDVRMFAFGQKDEPASQHGFDDAQSELGGG